MASERPRPTAPRRPAQAAVAPPVELRSASDSSCVELADGAVLVHELSLEGSIVTLAQQASEDGPDVEALLRQAVEVGAAVLLHGAAKGTVDAVSAEVDRLLTALNERSSKLEFVRRAREQIAARGFDFEQDLGPALDGCFAAHGDIFETTGTTKGIAEDKVGDFLLTVNPRDCAGHQRRVVFEAKDRQLSLAKALSELDAAMLNRSAQVGVMVFARTAQAPLHGRPLRVFPGNRILVVWEKEAHGDLALEVAAQLARTLAISVEREDARLNRRGIGQRVEQLLGVVERAGAIQTGLSTARRGLDAAEDAYESLRDDAMALLYELQDRL